MRKLSDPPDLSAMDPAIMSAQELRAAHESLSEWLDRAYSAPLSDAPDDEAVEAVEEKLVEISRERRDRHSDEPAPRGG